jgi:monoamine oxidase
LPLRSGIGSAKNKDKKENLMNKKIVIVGGGISGLTAANFLVRMGCEVTVLEAKATVGGRIYTVQDGGPLVELGAEFLHGDSPTVSNAIRAAGLTTQPITEEYHTFHDGLFQRVNYLSKINKLINHIYVQRQDCSFLEYLNTQNLPAADREQALGFVQGFHAANPELISAHALRRGEYSAQHMASTEQGRIVEGYGALIEFLAQDVQKHGGKLVTSTAVEKINWQPGQVELTCRQKEEHIIFKADAAIITLPLGVLKSGSVGFHPPLGVKREAIEQLHFGNVVKVIFQFRKTWWPDFGFVIALDEAFPTWWADARGPVLTAWAGGPKADALLDRSPMELERLGLETLTRIFRKYERQIAPEFVASHTFNWAHDPYTCGAYSYLPVNGLDLPKLLGAPLANTLFFAGEATVTDAQTGTVFGAFDTGLRAGREILAMIAETLPQAIYVPPK